MSRSSPHETDRIGIFECTWKRHGEFAGDIGRLNLDTDTWVALKMLMRRAAAGTVRLDEWEYPCASSRGAIGELKHHEECEVTAIKADRAVPESATVHYRVYFAEPAVSPEELWALGMGAKSWHPDFVGTNQQDDIELAMGRANTTTPQGVELLTFSP